MNEEYSTLDLHNIARRLKNQGLVVKIKPSRFDEGIYDVTHFSGDIDDLQSALNSEFGKDNYRISFDDHSTYNSMSEEYTVAGKKVKLNKGKNPNGTDWTVTFPNGKTADLADVLALIKPKPELTKENFNKVSGGIPYKVEGNKAIISTASTR